MPGYVTAPPPAAGVTGLVGSLVLIEVNGFAQDVQTAYGVKDEVDVTVTVVQNPNPSLVGTSTATKVYNTVLVSQLRNLVGQTTLGRLVMGQARNGNNAPIRLDPPTEADQRAADAFLASGPAAPAGNGLAAAPASPVGAPGAVPPPGYPAGPSGEPYGAPQPPAGYPAMPPGWNPTAQPAQPPF